MAVDAEILDGARAAIGRHGFAGATLTQIADAAGVSRMTLHRRGLGKPELLVALVERMVAEERAELWQPLAGPGSAAERLRATLDRRCRLAERHLDVLEALDATARDAIFHGPDGLTRPEFVEPVRRLLVDGAADGTLAPSPDPDEAATLLYNLVGHTYRHLRRGHGWEPDRAREGVLRIAMDGIAAR